jgi:hypothetical protein
MPEENVNQDSFEFKGWFAINPRNVDKLYFNLKRFGRWLGGIAIVFTIGWNSYNAYTAKELVKTEKVEQTQVVKEEITTQVTSQITTLLLEQNKKIENLSNEMKTIKSILNEDTEQFKKQIIIERNKQRRLELERFLELRNYRLNNLQGVSNPMYADKYYAGERLPKD